jgi:ketosteroid isomerase-like protein
VPDLEQAVADAFAAFQTGDFDALFALSAEDIDITQPPDIPDAKTYRGHAGLLEAFRDWPSQWDEFSVDLLGTEQLDDCCVISTTRQHLRARDLDLDVDIWNLHVSNGEKFTCWNMFLTREEALTAARDVRLRTG